MDGSNSNVSNLQHKIQKPTPLKTVKQYENKNLPYDEYLRNGFERSLNDLYQETYNSDKPVETEEEDSKTLNKMFNSF